MIQAIGITSVPRRRRRPVVDDLTFEARPGQVTALLGPDGAGKTTALRLVLQLERGRGVALFRGRPLRRVPHPVREIGVLLGDVPGHPGRTASGHLRMLAAVAGVPPERADELLDVVGLSGLAHQRLGSFSLGMDRRLGMAAALLGDPHTLVLDEPARGLSPREASWLHGLLREYAEQGGAVLLALCDPREAGRTADRIVSIDGGRLLADQDAADFARTRLRPRVAVSSPHAGRLATLLRREAGHPAGARIAGGGDVPEIVWEGGNTLSVYGSDCAAVGETAYRHGVLVHQLAEETGEAIAAASGPKTPLVRADGRATGTRTIAAARAPGTTAGAGTSPVSGASVLAGTSAASAAPTAPGMPTAAGGTAVLAEPQAGTGPGEATATDHGDADAAPTPAPTPAHSRSRPGRRAEPPRFSAVPRPGPAAPFRYELRRLLGLSATWYILAAALLVALVTAAALAATGAAAYGPGRPLPLLTGRPAAPFFLLTPAALAAGVLGALSFGQEFRYPALAPAQTQVPRRLGLLVAKLTVSACVAALLCLVTAALNAVVTSLLFGAEVLALPGDAPALPVQALSVLLLTVACAWAGLLAAGATRSTVVGLGAVAAVPTLVTPAVRELLAGSGDRSSGGFPTRLESVFMASWRWGGESWVTLLFRLLSRPAGQALVLSAAALVAGYALLALRARLRGRLPGRVRERLPGRLRRRPLESTAAGGGSNTASHGP